MPELLALFFGVRGIPGDVCWVSNEPVGHEDLVLGVFVGGCEDVGALNGLREVPEDVVDEEQGFGCGFGAGDVWLGGSESS